MRVIVEQDQQYMDHFTQEAELLLARSSGYLAVAYTRNYESLSWVDAQSSEQHSNFKETTQHLLGSLKFLTQTIPHREDNQAPRDTLSLQLAYKSNQSSDNEPDGILLMYGLMNGALILVTPPDELVERAWFWLKYHGNRIQNHLNKNSPQIS